MNYIFYAIELSCSIIGPIRHFWKALCKKPETVQEFAAALIMVLKAAKVKFDEAALKKVFADHGIAL